MLETLVPLFERGGVQLVLAGHEHNFQLSRVDGGTHVVSGAGGKLRVRVPKDRCAEAHTRLLWAPSHLLLVELDDEETRLAPVSAVLPDGRLHVMTALASSNQTIYSPFPVRGR